MATAATGATAATNDPTVISDWNEIAVTTLAGDTTKQGMGRRLTDWTLDHYFQPIHEEQER